MESVVANGDERFPTNLDDTNVGANPDTHSNPPSSTITDNATRHILR